MVQQLCPRCFVRVTYSPHIGDFVHECNSGQVALDQEDVLVVGNYDDYTTNGTVKVTPGQVHAEGVSNKLQGTEGNIVDGARDFNRTARGLNAEAYRVRQHLEHIETKNDYPAPDKSE